MWRSPRKPGARGWAQGPGWEHPQHGIPAPFCLGHGSSCTTRGEGERRLRSGEAALGLLWPPSLPGCANPREAEKQNGFLGSGDGGGGDQSLIK